MGGRTGEGDFLSSKKRKLTTHDREPRGSQGVGNKGELSVIKEMKRKPEELIWPADKRN